MTTPKFFLRIITLLALSLSSFVISETAIAGGLSRDAYNSIYPYNISVCVGSQVHPSGDEADNGWGHIEILLRGACRVRGGKFPQLQSCVPKANGSGEVLVSISPHISNVNWFAVENSDVNFLSDLPAQSRLTNTAFLRTAKKLWASGALEGIKVHPESRIPGFTDSQALAVRLLGYESVMTYGRDVWCARLPVTEANLKPVIQSLNDVNRRYYENQLIYTWSAFKNNCAHLVSNSLSALGLWKPMVTELPWPRALFGVAIPGNTFVSMMNRVTDKPGVLFDPVGIYLDRGLKNSLEKYHWLPMRHGVVTEYYKFHENNDVFEGNLGLKFFDNPFLMGRTRAQFNEFVTAPRYVDHAEGLKAFQGVYRQALAAASKAKTELRSGIVDPRLNPAEVSQVLRFLEIYSQYLEAQLSDVNRILRISQ